MSKIILALALLTITGCAHKPVNDIGVTKEQFVDNLMGIHCGKMLFEKTNFFYTCFDKDRGDAEKVVDRMYLRAINDSKDDLPDTVNIKSGEQFMLGVSDVVVSRYIDDNYSSFRIGADPICPEAYEDYKADFIAASK